MDEAIELIAQLVAYADSQSLDELRTVGTDEFLQEMNTSIDQLHSQFGDSCAHRQYERTLYEAVADLEAETEAGVAMLEMFSDCNLWRW
ncbi:MAG: hypothetical protein QNJ89_13365 [Acidimicrobiia bacterium]|nr:hypothetical protein [Acidimicrobiia bacterium]